jgi:catechol 2,3-dioxygenase-like lactoylglutathione lyase family enzyme
MKIKQLDHVALHVQDLAASVTFYGQVLGLPTLPRPDFDFEGAWFRIGQTQELHLIADRQLPVHSHSRGTHFAMAVENLSEWDEHLSAAGVPRTEVRLRPDGARQIFVRDPDDHWIELVQWPGEV